MLVLPPMLLALCLFLRNACSAHPQNVANSGGHAPANSKPAPVGNSLDSAANHWSAGHLVSGDTKASRPSARLAGPRPHHPFRRTRKAKADHRHQRQSLAMAERKRLSLFPAMGLDGQQPADHPPPSAARPPSQPLARISPADHAMTTKSSPAKTVAAPWWWELFQSSRSGSGTKAGNGRVRESIQTCLFLRSGCEKNHRRLEDFVQNMDVQERISNGFVLRRKS